MDQDDSEESSSCDSPFDEADDFAVLATTKPKMLPGSTFLRMYSCLVRAEEERNEAQRWNMRYREKLKQLRQEVESVTAQLLDSQHAYRLLLESTTRLPLPLPPHPTTTVNPQTRANVLEPNSDVEMVPVWSDSEESSSSDASSDASSSESEDFEVAQQLEFIRQAECEENSSGDETDGSGSDSASLEDPLDSFSPDNTTWLELAQPDSNDALRSETHDCHRLPDIGRAVKAAPIAMPVLGLSEVKKLMAAAQTDVEARKEVRAFLKRAHRTNKLLRTESQLYAMMMWRKPPSSTNGKTNVAPACPRPAAVLAPPPAIIPSSVHVPLGAKELFVDASGKGIGMVWGNRWFAWAHHPDSPVTKATKGRRIDMSWAELLAVELAIHTMLCIDIIACTTIVIRSDNKGVVQALSERKWTRFLQPTLDRILSICDQYKTRLVPIWVSTSNNLADGPSRGIFPDESLKLGPSVPTPDHLTNFFVNI